MSKRFWLLARPVATPSSSDDSTGALPDIVGWQTTAQTSTSAFSCCRTATFTNVADGINDRIDVSRHGVETETQVRPAAGVEGCERVSGGDGVREKRGVSDAERVKLAGEPVDPDHGELESSEEDDLSSNESEEGERAGGNKRKREKIKSEDEASDASSPALRRLTRQRRFPGKFTDFVVCLMQGSKDYKVPETFQEMLESFECAE